jgi:hypothetical protein
VRILNIRYKEVSVNPQEYIIDWDTKVSKPQKKVTDFLQPYWKSDLVLQEFRIPGSLLRIDLLNVTKKIIVEVSPDELHSNYNPFLHKDRAGFLKKLKADNQKMDWAERNKFLFVELTSLDIKNLSIELLVSKGILNESFLKNNPCDSNL